MPQEPTIPQLAVGCFLLFASAACLLFGLAALLAAQLAGLAGGLLLMFWGLYSGQQGVAFAGVALTLGIAVLGNLSLDKLRELLSQLGDPSARPAPGGPDV